MVLHSSQDLPQCVIERRGGRGRVAPWLWLWAWVGGVALVFGTLSCSKQDPIAAATTRSTKELVADLAGLNVGTGRFLFADGDKVVGLDAATPSEKKMFFTGAVQNAFIVADGSGVVAAEGGKIVFAPWSGGPPTDLGVGRPIATWQEPAYSPTVSLESLGLAEPGAVAASEPKPAPPVWIYALEDLAASAGEAEPQGKRLVKFRLNAPTERSVVSEGQVLFSGQTAQITPDGKHMAVYRPYPHAGMLELSTGVWKKSVRTLHRAWAPLSDSSGGGVVVDGTRSRLMVVPPPIDRMYQLEGWSLQPTLAQTRELDMAEGLRWAHPRALLAVGRKISTMIWMTPDLGTFVRCVPMTSEDWTLPATDAWFPPPAKDFIATASSFAADVLQPTPHQIWPDGAEKFSYLWRTDRHATQVPGRQKPCSLTRHGQSRFSGSGYMMLDQGFFEGDTESADAFVTAAKKENSFSVTFNYNEWLPENHPPLTRRLVSLSLPDGRDLFSISRMNNVLVLRVLMKKKADEPAQEYQAVAHGVTFRNGLHHHLNVGLDSTGSVIWSLNSLALQDFVNMGPVDLSEWQQGARLTFGDGTPPGASSWRANMSYVGLMAGTQKFEKLQLLHFSASQHHGSQFDPSRLRFRGKLMDKAPVPDGGVDAMVQHLYAVEEVLFGPPDMEYSVVSVFHPCLINNEPISRYPQTLGESVELLVESLGGHGEVAHTEVSLVSTKPFEHPLYVDPLLPQSLAAPAGASSPGGLGAAQRQASEPGQGSAPNLLNRAAPSAKGGEPSPFIPLNPTPAEPPAASSEPVPAPAPAQAPASTPSEK